MKKEDEMVNRLSQKFGITLNKTTNNKETTQMKTMTKNSPALQEALAGFLSITGQGMSIWMMQSMSNSTSDEIKKEYANEMMKQQILKICHNNAKMMRNLLKQYSCHHHPLLLQSMIFSESPPIPKSYLPPPCQHMIMKMRKKKKKKKEHNEGEEDMYTYPPALSIFVISTTL